MCITGLAGHASCCDGGPLSVEKTCVTDSQAMDTQTNNSTINIQYMIKGFTLLSNYKLTRVHRIVSLLTFTLFIEVIATMIFFIH